MIPRLARESEPAPRSTDLVDGWLRVFLSLLKLPQDQAASIREELEGHLRERVRDLMVAGAAEGDATKQAIAELGEAADVAARYTALRNEPRRRFLMHVMAFTAAGAALALSIAAFRGPKQPEVAQARDQLIAAQDQAQEYKKRAADLQARADVLEDRIRAMATQPVAAKSAAFEPGPKDGDALRFDGGFRAVPLGEALESLGKLADRPVNIRWTALEGAGYDRKAPVAFTVKNATVTMLLAAISEGKEGAAALDCRVNEAGLEIATRGYFDRRERELVSYDLSGIVAARAASYNEPRQKVMDEVAKLVIEFVSAEDWQENGGDLAVCTIVGDRLFIRAPRRMHPQIGWLVGQLPSAPVDAGRTRAVEENAIVLTMYRLKHTTAAELLAALKGMESLRPIDFAGCAADAATNSLLIKGTASQQSMVKIAVESLDRPAAKQPVVIGGVAVTPSTDGSGQIYVSGLVSRPGTYAVPAGGISVRRLLVATGGLPAEAKVVTVCESRDGTSKPIFEIEAEELRKTGGNDPELKAGQLVSVR